MTATLFTWIFLSALAVSTLVRFWLAQRQARYVLANRGSVPAAFREKISLSAHHKAADYTIAKLRVSILDIALGAAVLLLLTIGGLLQWGSELLARVLEPGGIWHGAAIVACVVLFLSVLELPIDLYRTFSVESRFGFNRMTLRLYLGDLAKQALVGALIGLPLVTLALWIMDGIGSLWWLYVWILWTGFNLTLLLVYPTFIAPLFNKFAPLQDTSLKERIESLLSRCGFRASGLYVMDGSKRSSHGNAYFTGFGAAKRIVMFDTLLSRLAPPEVEAVLAHELGHFRKHHVWKRIAVMFSISLALLWGLGQLIGKSWFYEGLNVSSRDPAMALLLFFLIVPVFLFLLQPIGSLYSRTHEYEADRYAAAQSSPGELINALVKLYQDNAATLTPDPVHSAFYDSHPPAALRVARLAAHAGTHP